MGNIKWFFIAFTLLLFVGCYETDITDKADKMSDLKAALIPVAIDSLEAIKQAIGDAEIVMLGEQNHTGGSTFLVKNKLIELLHQEMGFDVLIFESGLYSCHMSWLDFQAGKNPKESFEKSIFPIWTKSEQVTPLINYLAKHAQSNRPLELAGFDIQPTGTITLQERKENLMTTMNIDSLSFQAKYPAIFKLLSHGTKMKTYKKDSLLQDSVFHDFEILQKDIAHFADSSLHHKIWHRTIQTFPRILTLYWKGNDREPWKTPDIFNIRDEEMGKNLIWLKENIYPNRKVIVWAANAHLMRNRNTLNQSEKSGSQIIPAGEFVHQHFGDRAYFLAFTSHEGKSGSWWGKDLSNNRSSNKGMEYLIGEMDYEDAFIDFHNLPDSSYLKGRFIAKFLGHLNLEGKWSETADGVYYHDWMEASQVNKED